MPVSVAAAREREVLDALCRVAEVTLINSLPTPYLRIQAHLAILGPMPAPAWKGQA